jgi:hypothetical protein
MRIVRPNCCGILDSNRIIDANIVGVNERDISANTGLVMDMRAGSDAYFYILPKNK